MSVSHRPNPGEIDALFEGRCDLSEIVEDVACLGARLIIQAAVEAEVEVFLGRARYQPAVDCPDARPRGRNGFVSYAGLAPLLALAERAALSQLISDRVRIDPAATKVKSAGANPVGKLTSAGVRAR